jgi:hypothetical protein
MAPSPKHFCTGSATKRSLCVVDLYTTCQLHKVLSVDDWLTVHRSITLVDFQLDAQNSYLFTYNIFIKILYMFRALPCLSSGGLCRNFIYAASGIVTLCR